VLLAVGILISIVGTGILVVGIVAAGANHFRNAEGYFSAPKETFSTQTYALTSPTGEITVAPGVRNLPFELATIRLSATSTGPAIFIGIAPKAEIDHYLEHVKRTEVRSIRYFPFEVDYRDFPGTRAPAPPTEQHFWVQSASGTGTQRVQWSVAPGQWGLVVMNANGAPGVTTQLQAAVRSDLISPVSASIAIVIGGVLLLIGLTVLIIGAVLLGRGIPPSTAAMPPGATRAPGASAAPPVPPIVYPPQESSWTGRFPSRLEGVRDDHLSRGLWLVKWLLAIPHYVILVFLWFAFTITTVIAGVAILFTAHYPRSLFTFNVGVLRWSWRVGFYAYSALGTDRYPPFTLRRTDYPADFDIAYPDRLSRGLVLVKWWLLAIPHYVLLAAIGGSALFWQSSWNTGTRYTGLPLVTALVLIAGFALLFTARYPTGIFNLVVGINRWIFRVMTYAALFRDEYPPFRLDQGPREFATREGGAVASPSTVK
jgi:hypothetical protein